MTSMTTSLTDESFWEATWRDFQPKKVGTVMYADLFEKYLKPDASLECIEIGCFPGNFLVYFHKRFGYTLKVMNPEFLREFLESRDFEIRHLGYYGGLGFWVRDLSKRNIVMRGVIKSLIYFIHILRRFIKAQSRFFSTYMACIAQKRGSNSD